jgi:hypothetical protein
MIVRHRLWPRIWVGVDSLALILLYGTAIAVLFVLGAH